ncbi:Na+/H+ antiporter subunit E [Methylophaga sp. OBS3]|uniref:Na+/H+ antiporter subunit E n=1 Tax=Methylophaga sp. OBS3 TaxID=2991934 RepID=UPI00224F5E7E|nr:Na+/H+ antiporter subunit E [Methylophaga sp. OBS3]MCX4188822.1 Na+/H+ antiporter subunit E [Methylophaga sp. OBS3]
MSWSRIFPHPVLSLILWFIWLLLNNTASAGHMVLGALLAIFIPWFTSGFWPETVRIKKPVLLFKYIVLVLWEIMVANLVVAKMIMGRAASLNPGFISYELSLQSPIAISLLANTISLTPGTVSCDLSEDGKSLLIHALHIKDAAAIKAEIAEKFEQPLGEIFT